MSAAASPLPAGLPPELAQHPRYRILKELGRGGMGVVYQAEQTLMGRTVAIKVIGREVLAHADALERFRREIQAAARLTHPNIVLAYDAEQVGDLHMLVMEYVEGQSLAEVLRRKGPLPVAHACHFARQAALGLQHALERGMVHRDIKPHNLMLTPKGQVKILDFGLAKVVSETGARQSLTASGAYMGTPEYCAPEQATDARQADGRADIYACRGGRPVSQPFGIGDGTSLSSDQANFNGRYPYGEAAKGPNLQATCHVGSYPANSLGLFDMHGNVWEWCADWYAPYPPGNATNPTGPLEGSLRVIRGGGLYYGWACRAAYRGRDGPERRLSDLGFRLARSVSSGGK